MYAIVDIAGKQFSVREKDRLIVPRLKGNAKDTVTLDRVLLVAGNGDAHIGTPLVPNASVEATILEHVKGDKILVFRKKRRKRFKVKRGHRQPWTRIEITALSLGDEPHEKTAAVEEVASDAKNLAEAAPDEVTPDTKDLAEAAPDEAASDAKDPAEAASDEVDPDAKDPDEVASDEVTPDAKNLDEAAPDEVDPDAKDLAEVASDEAASDDAGENEAPEAEALSETAADAVEPEKEAAS